jgi:YbgC/YbaW family acyl-CoA thioester hydrolase
MAHEFKLSRLVEFSETDMAGIMHFSNYFRFMEATEHAFFRALGLKLHGETDGAMVGWARTHAECRYDSPLRYQDDVEVHLVVRAKTESSFTYDFAFRRPDPNGEPRTVARGALTVVCVTRPTPAARLRRTPMPAAVSERIDVAPAALFTPDGDPA